VESFAPFVSPRVGLLYDVLPQRVRTRASFGRSYRTPSFDELFWPPRASAAGNPDLRAERGRDWDAGLDVYGLPADLRVTIDAFYRTVDDLIQWVPGASGIWRPHNVGRARLAGVESNAIARIPITEDLATRWQASGSWMSTRDETGEPNVDGRELVYRPRWSGHAGVTLETARLGELETTWTFVDDVFVTRANTKVLDGSLRGDVRYRVAVSARVRVDLSLTNLLDERTRDFRDYPLPGRSWTVGLTLEDLR
jgi:outer membrane receptor protein involved in Fe transport